MYYTKTKNKQIFVLSFSMRFFICAVFLCGVYFKNSYNFKNKKSHKKARTKAGLGVVVPQT